MSEFLFQENPMDYELERPFFEQEGNSARYYITGKGVCLTDGGALFAYEMPPEDMGAFCFGEMVLNEYLSPNFTENEQRELSLVQTLDKQAQQLGLHVVSTQNNGKQQYAVFFCEQSQAYFRVNLDQIDRMNIITANLMMQMREPNILAEPYEIDIDERGVIG